MNPFREKTEYIVVSSFLTVLHYCPATVIYGLCRLFAAIVYMLARKRRRITLNNLGIAFPNLPEKEKRRIASAAYDNFGQFLAESAMILCRKIRHDDLMKMVDGSDITKLLELEKNSKIGILFITGHLGNFELLAHYTGLQMKRSGYVIARKGTNQLIDDRIVTPMRESFGNTVAYKSRALSLMARALRKGEHIGLLTDIKTNIQQGVPILFFGKETLAVKSSAYLQIKLNVPVVPVAMVRVGSRHYKLIVNDPIPWQSSNRPLDEQITELTQLHQNALEKLIRQYPAQWLWMHDRWRTS